MSVKMNAFPDIFSKQSCTYCLDEIVGIRVKCVECTDFDLCLQCFSSGAEIGPHKNDHSYQFVDPGAVEVFRSKNKWTAREELELLTGIEQYGFGNWDAISKHIKTRSPEEVRDEYTCRYVEGSIGRCTWAPAYTKRSKLKDLGTDLPPTSHTPELTLPMEVTPHEATFLGFMPNRGDFEREYQNEAENLVSRLNLNCTYEEDLDIALTLAHVDIYMDRLRERAKRKKVVNDYQLISKFFADRKDRHTRRRSSSDQEVEDKLKFVAKLLSVDAHDSLVRRVQRQKELSIRMKELLRYRKAGLTHLEELPHYEQELAQSRGASGSSLAHSHQTEEKKSGENESEESTPCSDTKSSTLPTDSHGSLPGTERLQLLGSISIPDSSQLLSSTETQICSFLEITPFQFISIKTFFILNPEEEAESTMEKVIQNHIKSNGWYISSV